MNLFSVLALAVSMLDDKPKEPVKITDEELSIIRDNSRAVASITKEIKDRYQAELTESTARFMHEIDTVMNKKCKEAGLERAKCQINIKTREVEEIKPDPKP